jgi:molecular chaperone GrpE
MNKDSHSDKNKDNQAQELNEKKETVVISKEEFEQLRADADKAKEHWDRLLRQQADFDNTRKRLDKEKQDFVRFANEELIFELLTVLDDLERTVGLAQEKHEDLSAFLKGVEMILAHLYDLLKKFGVKPIEAEGKIFDPHFHEALMQVENKDLPEHTVVEELQKGYLLNDRVIRTTKAKVSKKTMNNLSSIDDDGDDSGEKK